MTPSFLMSGERNAVSSILKTNLCHLINVPFLSPLCWQCDAGKVTDGVWCDSSGGLCVVGCCLLERMAVCSFSVWNSGLFCASFCFCCINVYFFFSLWRAIASDTVIVSMLLKSRHSFVLKLSLKLELISVTVFVYLKVPEVFPVYVTAYKW